MATAVTTPHLEERGEKKILVVNGEPFIMIAGEVHNSASSTTVWMENVWDKARSLGMNTLLLPVAWEQIEPREGVFDFSLVDGLIAQARRRNMKIGFLWFGAWKNAQCYYAPAWVKTDLARFKRAEMTKGENKSMLTNFHGMSYTSLSYVCDATREADSRAFAKLMAHLAKVDAVQQTVVWMQVENETGVMGAAREHSDAADQAFVKTVPQAFAAYMRANTGTMVPDVKAAVESGAASGSWSEVFGEAADEIFSAYHVASYIEAVAVSGLAEYSLPLSANCWLDQGGGPGVYPSGGPVRRMMEVWHYCAPHINALAPDIYVPNFCEVCDRYTELGNPLMIPEAATHSYCGPRMVYTVGHHHALCYSPFGFEEMGEPFGTMQGFLFGMDVTDPALKTPQNVEEYAWYAKTLQSLLPLLSERYGTRSLQAVCAESAANGGEDTMVFGSFGIKALMDKKMSMMFGGRTDGVCLALAESRDTFYVIACGCSLAPFSTNPSKPNLDFLEVEEGSFVNGKWQVLRRLNGDEVAIMAFTTPTLLKLHLFAYK